MEDVIAKLIVRKGVAAVDTSMFTPAQRKEIYSRAADDLLRLNRNIEAFAALQLAGRDLPVERFRKRAQELASEGQYKEAADLFEAIGDRDMAEMIRGNFPVS